MRPRNTVIALVVLIIFGAYLYVVEIRGAAQKASTKEKESHLFSVAADAIRTIAITHEGRTVAMERNGESWSITTPVVARGDAFTSGDVARAIAELAWEAKVDASASAGSDERYAPFGLDEPATKVVYAGDDASKGELWIGHKTPIGDSFYARTADGPDVYVIPAFSAMALQKDLFALRDKRVLDFKDDDVTGLQLALHSETARLVREGGRWRMVAPVADVAREDVVRQIVDTLRFLEATAFVDDANSGLARFGLDPPFARIELELGDAMAPQVLLVGTKVPDEEAAYVARHGTTSVAEVAASILTDVQKRPTDLRESRALPFDRWDVSAFDLDAAGEGFSLTKSDSGEWQVARRKDGVVGTPEVGDWRAIDDYLEELEGVEVASFLDTAPAGVDFEMPVARISVTQTKSAPRTFAVAAGGDGALFVKDADRTFVLAIAADARARIVKSASDLRQTATGTAE